MLYPLTLTLTLTYMALKDAVPSNHNPNPNLHGLEGCCAMSDELFRYAHQIVEELDWVQLIAPPQALRDERLVYSIQLASLSLGEQKVK